MPKRPSTRQKTRRTMEGRRTSETPRGKRPAYTQRLSQKKQRRGAEPRLRAGQ